MVTEQKRELTETAKQLDLKKLDNIQIPVKKLRLFEKNSGRSIRRSGKTIFEENEVHLALFNSRRKKAILLGGEKQKGQIVDAEMKRSQSMFDIRFNADNNVTKKYLVDNFDEKNLESIAGVQLDRERFPSVARFLEAKHVYHLKTLEVMGNSSIDAEGFEEFERNKKIKLDEITMGKAELLDLTNLVRENSLKRAWNSEYREAKSKEEELSPQDRAFDNLFI